MSIFGHERNGVPMYGPNSVDEIMRERGCSRADATRIAASTMDGANETPGGDIEATQTMCDELHYDESVTDQLEEKDENNTTPLSRFQIF